MTVSKHYIISGRVQGVGFRYYVARQARALGLTGWVRNLPDGRVEAIAAGPQSAVDEFEGALRQRPFHVSGRFRSDPGCTRSGLHVIRGELRCWTVAPLSRPPTDDEPPSEREHQTAVSVRSASRGRPDVAGSWPKRVGARRKR